MRERGWLCARVHLIRYNRSHLRIFTFSFSSVLNASRTTVPTHYTMALTFAILSTRTLLPSITSPNPRSRSLSPPLTTTEMHTRTKAGLSMRRIKPTCFSTMNSTKCTVLVRIHTLLTHTSITNHRDALFRLGRRPEDSHVHLGYPRP